MTAVVLDSSALIAWLRREPGADNVEARLADAVIGDVNFAEVIGYYARNGAKPGAARLMIAESHVGRVPTDESLAFEAGALVGITAGAGLSLGDRFCLALAKRRDCPALTADRRWLDVAELAGVKIELIR